MVRNDETAFRGPAFLARGQAIAIAGRVDTVYSEQEKKHLPLPKPVPLKGVSCALPGNGGESSSEGNDLQTDVPGEGPVARVKYARAIVSAHIVEDNLVQTIARTQVTDMLLGAKEPMMFADSGVELKSTARLKEWTPTRFTMSQHLNGAEYRGKLLHIAFDALPETYDQVIELLSDESSVWRKRLLPYSPLKLDNLKSRKPIALHIVKHLDWPGFAPVLADTANNGLRHEQIGHVYFGEVLISERRRRFTLLRFELGSPVGGTVSSNEIEENGDPPR